MEMLVVPRLIGLVITLPLLTFYADMMGLLGGGVISLVQLDVSPVQYVDRVRHAVDGSDLFVGLVRLPSLRSSSRSSVHARLAGAGIGGVRRPRDDARRGQRDLSGHRAGRAVFDLFEKLGL
jgi:hypothetical protein